MVCELNELLYCVEGNVHQIVNGHAFSLQTGDWLFMGAGTRHETRNASRSPFAFFVFHFETDDQELRKFLHSLPFQGHIPKAVADQSQLSYYADRIVNTLSESTGDHKVDKAIMLSFTQKLEFHAYIMRKH
jgi:hypothetical protein